MPYFVIQVSSSRETECRTLLIKTGLFPEKSLVFPRRKLMVRKKGKIREQQAPLFPGYLFFRCDEVHPDQIRAVRQTPGVFNFLNTDGIFTPLYREEEEQLDLFMRTGEIAGISTIDLNENNKIIVKIDKRKKRAKVRLSLYKEAFLIDFGFDFVKKS
ncbi:MAG: hypothetical protein B6241_07965 [Spirochaetaceae bacterium 4572_59]|nr:MAG: hypothetical protein B6241_07965 [Spirochaetaceae bacterium 4572_59]